MAYTLTLTASERKAIDWIGDRYAHGNDLYRALFVGSKCNPDDADWDDPRDMTFNIPEHVAWEICDIIAVDDLACFADELKAKLYRFSDKVV